MVSPFKILAKDSSCKARTGILYTRHGAVHTPVFMPVATQACVKALTDEDLENAGAECLLSNTYHLYLRPTTKILQTMGGIHKFMHWGGSILTDSGGFQVYSLSKFRKINEEGVTFQSHHDGSKHLFTPENVIQFESEIGSDIWTMLDVCIHAKDPSKHDAREALNITKRWAERAAKAYAKTVAEQQISQQTDGSFSVGNSLLFGIIQGSIFPDLRKEAALHMASLPTHGYCLGGLSLGETLDQMNDSVLAVTENLPEQKPRYFMGLGTPVEMLNAIERGVDMFDCVWPTRVGRNGMAMTSTGRVNIKNAEYRTQEIPLDPQCDCYTCRRFSRAYLCHLYRSAELTSHRLMSIHNIRFLIRLMERAREAITNGTFLSFKEEVIRQYLAK
ncbi:tRNA guanosine(34) transglycosylase Tgt [Candidatus Avelusimicrobium luingense]|uniref:tRNA guanosine(34) transglycosylase Tgt n=1 Tax=Candidatus Avelusimicrobium luingense TaxID=3416211 RepID=UPI003D151182